jgi:hypothetical protein
MDYSNVPFFCQLSEHRYDKENLNTATQVGSAQVYGGRLVLVLDPNAAVSTSQIQHLAILNQNVAYETRRRLKSGDVSWRGNFEGAGRQIGTVHWTGVDRLIALIRPFVVMDSGLW